MSIKTRLLIVSFLLMNALSHSALSKAPYAVGSKTIFIYDTDRPFDALGGVNKGVRSLITEIWYPADKSKIEENSDEYRLATYGDYVFGDESVHHKMMTQTTFFHLTPETVREGVTQTQIDAAIADLFKQVRNSYVDAPLADSEQPFPVVVMTHGDAGSRYNMETACEYLAMHGYVVIAPEHTGNSPYAFAAKDPAFNADFSDQALRKKMQAVLPLLNADGTHGSTETYGQTYTPLVRDMTDMSAITNLDQALVERVNDLRTAIEKLESMNSEGEFANRLDLNRLGVMGRSFGGMTSLAALALEDRFRAGVSVVPLVLPDLRSKVDAEYLVDAPAESVLLNVNGSTALNHVHKPTLYLSGDEDALIIGAGMAMADALGGPMPSAENPHAVLRAAYEDSNMPAYWGLLRDSNHGSFGVSGAYWWPHLKPSTQSRTFDPETTFQVIDPKIAHQIQQTKILEFFDVYLANKEGAMKQLEENKYVDQGFEFEFLETTAKSNTN
ncbi:MAG: prolyl oligopeptidase family serine peptidase [Pseudomonadota bacterium]